MKVLITGGHFSPAYSLIKELKARGHEVMIAGRRYPFEEDKSESFEYLVAMREKIPFFEIKTGRFQRKFTAYTLTSLAKTPEGFTQAVKLLKKAHPDVVLTFGGYIGLPISYAAALLRIPVVLHEQTQSAGLASRLIAKVAKKVCISFRDSALHFPSSKTIFTGNPIRDEIFTQKDEISLPSGKVIYITGGSTGSHFINSVILSLGPRLLEDFVLIHQTGESLRFNDFDKLSELRESLPENLKKKYILKKFILPSEIGFVFKSADLIISRSGANTIFEILAMQKMSILIPLPHGQNNEQLVNAKLIKNLGVGEYLIEDEATPEKVWDTITEMIKNEKVYKSNMSKTESFIARDAAQKIADTVESYGKKNG